MKNKVGRPSKYTPHIGAEICRRLTEGETIRQIAGDDGMPSWATINNWLNKYPDFLAQYARAREEQADSFAEEAIGYGRAAAYGQMDPNAARVAIDTLKWAAGKRSPKVYGDKQTLEHTGKDGGPIKAETTIDVDKLSTTTLKELLAARRKAD